MHSRTCPLTHVVALAVIILMLFSLIVTISGIPLEDQAGISSASNDEVCSSLSLDFASTLVTCNVVRQSDADGLLFGYKNLLNSLLLAIIPPLVFVVNKVRSLPFHFCQAGACINLISISLGGHAPPSLCA